MARPSEPPNPAASTPPPVRAVWETTWRCNLRCHHCLVEAGPNDKRELSTEEGLDLCDQLAALGVDVVSLTGGEPLMRKDWAVHLERLADHGLRTLLSTNGDMVPRVLPKLEDLGVHAVVLSVDGLGTTHDALRPVAETGARISTRDRVDRTLAVLEDSPVRASVITSVTKANLAELPALHEDLADRGVEQWMVQLAHPTGRMRGLADQTLEPGDLSELSAFLVHASSHPQLAPMVHNTIGYMSAKEPILRQSGRPTPWPFWRGSPCGRTVLALEPDGGVKGCPNQVGDPFIVGNVRTESLSDIWQDRSRWFWLHPEDTDFHGACAPCGLKHICKGGCPCVAHAATGRVFDNPFCLRTVEARA